MRRALRSNAITVFVFSVLLLIPVGLPYSEAQIDNTYKFDAGFYDKIAQMQSGLRVQGSSEIPDSYYNVIIITSDKNDLISDLQNDYNARNIFDPENLENIIIADVPISQIFRLAEIHNVVKIGDGELELEPLTTYDPGINFHISIKQAKEYHGVTSQITQTGNRITIGVIDAYNNERHDDLPNSDIIDRRNCHGPTCTTTFPPDTVRGTHFNHAASIITGTGASNPDMTGIAPDSMVRLAIVNDNDSLVKALDYLVGTDVDLITMIAGSRSFSTCVGPYNADIYQSIALIIDNVVRNGIPVITSNGNYANHPDYPSVNILISPACSYNSIGVGNTYISGTIHPSSSLGPAYGAINPDISAVGTTVAGAATGTGYNVRTGTSISAPIVAGVATLLLDKDASLSSNELRTALLTGAEFGQTGVATAKLYENTANTDLRDYIHAYGFGKLNAATSLNMINDNRFPNIISDYILDSTTTKKYRIMAESGDAVKVLMSWNVETAVRQGSIILAEGSVPLDSLKNYDLKITTPDGTEITSDSAAQNKEFVFFDADQSGIYEITVSLDDQGLRTVGYALGSSHPIDADPYDVDFLSLECQENPNCQTPSTPDPPTISAITIPSTSSSTATHVLAVSNVPTGYSFASATPAANLSDDNVTASGDDVNGTVTITFGLPTVSSSTPITGDLNVRYSDGTDNLDVVVPVTITVVPSTIPLPDPPTISAITIPSTSSSTATHVLAVSNVPTGYSFASATPAANLSDDNVTASGVDSNGAVTITFGLPTVNTSTPITGDLNVRYSDGTNDLPVVPVPVTITVVPPDPPTISAITIPSTSSSTATHVLAVSNVPTGYSFASATPAANLSDDNVTASGEDVNGTVTITFGLPTVSTSTPITGDLNVVYSNGIDDLDVVVSVTITVVPVPPIQLPLRLSADGILTNTYTDYLHHSSVYFHVGTQFTPSPSNVIVQLTDTDYVYSAFLGDRSTAFITDDFFNFRIYNTGTDTTPYYYASVPTNLVEIPKCTVNSFNGDRPAVGLVACYDSNTTQGGTIEIRTFNSGNYVLVSEGDALPIVRTNTGLVSLDRPVYPVPFGIPSDFGTNNDNNPNGRSVFPIHATGLDNTDGLGTGEFLTNGDLTIHIKVNDPDFNVNPSDEDYISQNVAGEEYGPVKISVLRGSSTVILGYAGGPDSNDGMIGVGDSDNADLRQFGPMYEIAPNAGIYELDMTIRFTDGPADSQCPNDVRYGGATDTASERFNVPSDYSGEDFCILQGDILQVEYTDPTDASGDSNTVTDSATFDLRDGILQPDKTVYIVGSDMILTVIDFDLDLDNDVAEAYDLDLIEWDSDTATLTMGNEGGETAAFDPDFIDLRETGDSTGIFQTVIKIPEELKGDKLGRGEEIILEYTDWSPSGSDYVGDADVDLNWTLFTSNFGATVEFDQQSYTWTDKVYITLIAPDFNFDADLADEIGGSDNPITISTRGFDLDEYTLVEMGTDTGFFDGEVTLTGFTYDADGDPTTGINGNDIVFIDPSGTGPTNGLLPATSGDDLTVSFEFSEDRTIVDSVPIRWNIGEVQWLEASYSATGTGIVRIVDPDMNLYPEVVDNFNVNVWSDSDAGGIDLTVTETNEATGIFEGTVFFIVDESSGQRLRVAGGDTVTVEYEDHTLPDPYTTADDLDITATSLIEPLLDPQPPQVPPVVDPPQVPPVVDPPQVPPVVQLEPQLSANGILTNTYAKYLDLVHSSVYFHVGTQFTPVPSNIIVELTDTDFVYSAFVGDRSVAFTTDDFFNFRIFNTGTDTTPYYYASDPTNLVEIPKCTVNSFNGDRPAVGLVACYDSNTTQGGTIEIRTFNSGNYVLVAT